MLLSACLLTSIERNVFQSSFLPTHFLLDITRNLFKISTAFDRISHLFRQPEFVRPLFPYFKYFFYFSWNAKEYTKGCRLFSTQSKKIQNFNYVKINTICRFPYFVTGEISWRTGLTTTLKDIKCVRVVKTICKKSILTFCARFPTHHTKRNEWVIPYNKKNKSNLSSLTKFLN